VHTILFENYDVACTFYQLDCHCFLCFFLFESFVNIQMLPYWYGHKIVLSPYWYGPQLARTFVLT
jgi:hypothetical protein